MDRTRIGFSHTVAVIVPGLAEAAEARGETLLEKLVLRRVVHDGTTNGVGGGVAGVEG